MDGQISFFLMSCCWVNAWGCFHHNSKIYIFRWYFWPKPWSKTLECIWQGLDCLISFFMVSYRLGKSLVMCFFFFNFFKFPEIFLFLGHFWAPYTQTLVQNLQGAPQKGWVVQFLATFLIHVERFQAKFSWGFALILFDFCEKISQK